MKFEPSKLARLVMAYYQMFGQHVPESALRLLDASRLVPILQDSLATNSPLTETEWGTPSPFEFSPRGCIVREESPESATPTKGRDGKSLQ